MGREKEERREGGGRGREREAVTSTGYGCRILFRAWDGELPGHMPPPPKFSLLTVGVGAYEWGMVQVDPSGNGGGE